MTVQFAVATRNAMLDAIEVEAGTSTILKIRTGAQPATCATADSGSVLATLNLPADYFGAAAAGVKSKSGTWEDTSADATGTAAHWRLYKTDGTTCVAQGSVSGLAGGGDLELQNVSVVATQALTITSWAFTAGNP